MSVFIPKMLLVAMFLNESGIWCALTHSPPATIKVAPLKTYINPKEAMIGKIPILETNNPKNNPQIIPTIIPNKTANTGFNPGNAPTVSAAIIPDSASVAPIDKSIPLVNNTIIIPIAKIANIAVFVNKSFKLLNVKNCEFNIWIIIDNMIINPSKPNSLYLATFNRKLFSFACDLEDITYTPYISLSNGYL